MAQVMGLRLPGNAHTATILALWLLAGQLSAVASVTGEPRALRVVSDWSRLGGGLATGVAVCGDIAYVAAGVLQVWDLSVPDQPRRIGGTQLAGMPRAIRVSGNYAYVAGYILGANFTGLWMPCGFLEVVDVSQPATPKRIGHIITPGLPHSLCVVDATVYVADGDAGLQVFDARNQAGLVRVGGLPCQGNALAVQVNPPIACVLSSAGLQVANVQDPARPVLVGWHALGGQPAALALADGVAYVGGVFPVDTMAMGMHNLEIVDIRDPAKPRQIARKAFGGRIADLQAQGAHAFAVLDTGGLIVVDAKDPAQPSIAGKLPWKAGEPTHGYGLNVATEIACLAAGHGGVVVADVRNPRQPAWKARFHTENTASALCLKEQHAYVADSATGLSVIDLWNPTRAEPVGRLDVPGGAQGVALSGDYAVLAGAKGVTVIDVRSPSRPIAVGACPLGDLFGSMLAVTGDHALLVSSFELHVLDLRVPSQPVRVGGHRFEVPPLRLHVAGSVAYVAAGRLVLLDLANLQAPREAASYAVEGDAQAVATAGDLVYVAGRKLVVYSRESPFALMKLGECELVPQVFCLCVTNQTALALDAAGLEMVDVSDPRKPRPIGCYPLQSGHRFLRVADGRVFLGGGLPYLEELSNLLVPPVIVEPPSAPRVARGSNAVLEVRALGRAPLRYQWFKGRSGDTTGPVAGATQRRHTTPPLRIAEPLWVRVENDAGHSDSPAVEANLVQPVLLESVGSWRREPGVIPFVMTAEGERVFYDDPMNGLCVIDFSRPSSPRMIGSTHPWETNQPYAPALALAARNRFLFAATTAQSHLPPGFQVTNLLEVHDISDPKVPRRAGSCGLSGPAKRIRLAASTACVLCDALGSDNGVLDIIDLRQPTQPNRMGSHAVSGRVHGLAVSGAHAWIAALSSGLIAVDISRPNAPTRVSRTPLAGAALDVAIVANSAFVLHTRDQRTADIDVFDLRNAATPRRIGSCHLDSMCLAIEPVGDRLIFSARSESETGYLVGMLDIVDPSRPALVGSLQVQAGLIHPLTATSFYSAGPNGVNLVRFAGGSGPTP